VRAESEIPGHGPRVLFFLSAGIGDSNTNPLDRGLDGEIGGGDAQFRVILMATGLGSTVLRIGTGCFGDGVIVPREDGDIIQAEELDVAIAVVPEPSAALLVALGLAAFESSRRRSVA